MTIVQATLSPKRFDSVLVDGKNLALSQGTGVASYAKSLCANLTEMGINVQMLYGESIDASGDGIADEIAFFDKSQRKKSFVSRYVKRFIDGHRELIPKPLHFDLARMQQQYLNRLPAVDGFWNVPHVFDQPNLAFRRGNVRKLRNTMDVDAAHWTYPVPLQMDSAANIYTLHDLVPLMLPDTTLDNKRAYFKMVSRIANTADLIVTVSQQSKEDIHSFFKLPDEKVINTYQDVDVPQELLNDNDTDVAHAVRGIFGLTPGNYILFYGAIEPKKNVGRLIEAHLGSGLAMPLVIAGKDGWLIENELRLYHQHIERRDGPLRIIRLPYVSRQQLINLTRAACAVAFPSLYEGFGLPLVEAMICGTPLLTSNIGAMREIAGNASLFVDPYDVGSIRDGLRRLAGDPILRAELVAAGHERAALFSSKIYRARLEAAYASIR